MNCEEINLTKLTVRETEILVLINNGKTNNEMAKELFLSVGTIKRHVHNILEKCNAKNTKQLILFIKAKTCLNNCTLR